MIFLFDPNYRPVSIKKYTEAKLERWAIKLHDFPFQIEHIDGESNVWADLISRWAAPEKGEVSPSEGRNSVTAGSVSTAKISSDVTSRVAMAPDGAGPTVDSLDLASSSSDFLKRKLTSPPRKARSVINPAPSRYNERSEKVDRIVTEEARVRSAQCFTGVRPLQKEDFGWPDLEEILITQQYIYI